MTNLTMIDESDLQLASWRALPSDKKSFYEGWVQPSPLYDMLSQLGSKDLVLKIIYFPSSFQRMFENCLLSFFSQVETIIWKIFMSKAASSD